MRTLLTGLGCAAVVVAIGLAWHGLGIMYDNSYSARIVGGDAYNYIIYATRGTAFVCAGVVAALIAVFCMIWSGQLAKETREDEL